MSWVVSTRAGIAATASPGLCGHHGAGRSWEVRRTLKFLATQLEVRYSLGTAGQCIPGMSKSLVLSKADMTGLPCWRGIPAGRGLHSFCMAPWITCQNEVWWQSPRPVACLPRFLPWGDLVAKRVCGPVSGEGMWIVWWFESRGRMWEGLSEGGMILQGVLLWKPLWITPVKACGKKWERSSERTSALSVTNKIAFYSTCTICFIIHWENWLRNPVLRKREMR